MASVFRVAGVVVGVTMWVGGLGCQPNVKVQGREGVEASYSFGTLKAQLPESVRVPAVMAALDEELRDRGYLVTERSVTADIGQLTAHAPRYSNYPRVLFLVKQTATGTSVQITNQPFGDEDQCRSLMDGLLKKLGL